MNGYHCKGDCGDVFFYEDNEPLCILSCKKQLENGEVCVDCFKDRSQYCDNLRDKKSPLYPQGCKLGNATSPLWCEKKERCGHYENKMHMEK